MPADLIHSVVFSLLIIEERDFHFIITKQTITYQLFINKTL